MKCEPSNTTAFRRIEYQFSGSHSRPARETCGT